MAHLSLTPRTRYYLAKIRASKDRVAKDGRLFEILSQEVLKQVELPDCLYRLGVDACRNVEFPVESFLTSYNCLEKYLNIHHGELCGEF
jgi:hypothetical protein